MMTLENCYQHMGENYANVWRLIPSETLIKEFVGEFLKEPSYKELDIALSKGDCTAAFNAAHTLKGICANLCFEKLRASVSALTEVLRPESEIIPQEAFLLWDDVQINYHNTVDCINAFFEEK